jgi:hypothetical protein
MHQKYLVFLSQISTFYRSRIDCKLLAFVREQGGTRFESGVRQDVWRMSILKRVAIRPRRTIGPIKNYANWILSVRSCLKARRELIQKRNVHAST